MEQYGFDEIFHNQLKADLQSGRIGLSQNRLPISSKITDVLPGDVVRADDGLSLEHHTLGMEAIKRGELAVVSLAGGAGVGCFVA